MLRDLELICTLYESASKQVYIIDMTADIVDYRVSHTSSLTDPSGRIPLSTTAEGC